MQARATGITLDGPTVNGIPVTDGPTNHQLLLSTVDNDGLSRHHSDDVHATGAHR